MENEVGAFEAKTHLSRLLDQVEPVHNDPFDRLQTVQARHRGWQVISRDPVFEAYGLRRVW